MIKNGGKRPGAGRKKGVPNKISGTVKDNVIAVFDKLGGTKHMANWAMENQSDFYKIYAKLLPTEISAEVEGTLEISWQKPK